MMNIALETENLLRKDGVPSTHRYKIVKVVKLSSKSKKITIKNSLDSSLMFIYDGMVWRWESTGHLVDGDVSRTLTKQYLKYLKKESKNEI